MNAHDTGIGTTGLQQNLFLQMEAEREGQTHVLREDYIPVFVAKLLRNILCPNDESTLGKSAFKFSKNGNKAGEDLNGKSSEQWTDDSFMEEYSDFESSFLLPEQSVDAVHRVLRFTVEAMDLFAVDSRKLWQCLLEEIEFPNLELLWLLDAKYHLLSLSNYLMMLKRPTQVEYIERQFLALCCSTAQFQIPTRARYAKILEHFLYTFLISAYSNPGGSCTTLKDIVDSILFQLTCKLVSNTKSVVSDVTRQFVLSAVQEVGLPNSIKTKHFSHQLTQLLNTKNTDVGTKSTEVDSLDQVIQCQEKFAGLNYGNVNQPFEDVMHAMIGSPMLPADVSKVISMSIKNPNRNWDRIFFLITEWLRKLGYEAANHLKEIIKTNMTEGVSSQNEELISLAFILARHCSLVSPPAQRVFPRYELWFAEMFSEFESPAKNFQTFSFLIKTLKRWIPFDPIGFLQVQLKFWPFFPPPDVEKCRDTWKNSYVILAKVRVAEYEEVEGAMALEPKPNNPTQIQVKVLQDIQMAITDYEKTKQIPLSVGQMTLFNKQYFLGHFLPTLLKQPTDPSLATARLRLIAALNQNDKIPKEMYAAYCLQ